MIMKIFSNRYPSLPTLVYMRGETTTVTDGRAYSSEGHYIVGFAPIIVLMPTNSLMPCADLAVTGVNMYK